MAVCTDAAKATPKHVCFPCKRKFPTATTLARHEQRSDVHRRQMERREDKMQKRKRDLILAARAVRQQIAEAEDALQSQANVNETVQHQKIILEMQLQQLLGEFGQAQETIEEARETREAKHSGLERPSRNREARVGKLALTAAVASWQSNKDVQEDRFILDIQLESPDGHLIAGFAVLDGHSGSLCVDHVVAHLPGALQRCLSERQALSDESLTEVVTEACAVTDELFLQEARQTEVLDGTTLILALVYPQVSPAPAPAPAGEAHSPGCCRLLVACVGDSRAVLCRSVGSGGPALEAVPLSEDHKPNRPDEQRRIEARGGIVDFEGVWRVFIPGPARFGGQLIARWGLAVSRAFGDLLLKESERYDCAGVAPGGLITAIPEIRIVDLEPSVDRFCVLASDGVWDVISNEDAVSICAAQADTAAAAQHLLRRTYAANSDDNLTALVLTWRTIT